MLFLGLFLSVLVVDNYYDHLLDKTTAELVDFEKESDQEKDGEKEQELKDKLPPNSLTVLFQELKKSRADHLLIGNMAQVPLDIISPPPEA